MLLLVFGICGQVWGAVQGCTPKGFVVSWPLAEIVLTRRVSRIGGAKLPQVERTSRKLIKAIEPAFYMRRRVGLLAGSWAKSYRTGLQRGIVAGAKWSSSHEVVFTYFGPAPQATFFTSLESCPKGPSTLSHVFPQQPPSRSSKNVPTLRTQGLGTVDPSRVTIDYQSHCFCRFLVISVVVYNRTYKNYGCGQW